MDTMGCYETIRGTIWGLLVDLVLIIIEQGFGVRHSLAVPFCNLSTFDCSQLSSASHQLQNCKAWRWWQPVGHEQPSSFQPPSLSKQPKLRPKPRHPWTARPSPWTFGCHLLQHQPCRWTTSAGRSAWERYLCLWQWWGHQNVDAVLGGLFLCLGQLGLDVT